MRFASKRRAGLFMALAAFLLVLSWTGLQRRDDGWLLVLGGRPMDAWGTVSVAVQDAVRSCGAVERVLPSHPQALAAIAALRDYSPPDSASARVLALDRLGAWWVLQAEFQTLEPVVVVVHQTGAQAQVVAHAVWSSTTRPWNPSWRIRRFIGQREPQVPAELLRCLDPLPLFAQPPGAPRAALPGQTLSVVSQK